MEWNFGDNERLDDQKRLKLLKTIEGVADIPYEYKLKIIAPMLQKLSGDVDEKVIADILKKRNEERKGLRVTYGEL